MERVTDGTIEQEGAGRCNHQVGPLQDPSRSTAYLPQRPCGGDRNNRQVASEGSSQLMITLRRPAPDDEDAFLKARSAVPADNPTFLRDYRQDMTYVDFLRVLEDHRAGRGLPPDVAPSSFLFAFDHGRIVGRASIRHRLTPQLGKIAGHIGYAVLPEFRNRGYATQILQASVRFAHNELRLDRVLVTCDDDNAASIRVIEKNDGVFEDIHQDATLRRPKRRYWIDASVAQPDRLDSSVARL